jgi:hypothetical protein
MRQASLPKPIEPPLDEVLSDPIIRLVMRRDGVTPAALRRCIVDARMGLARAAVGRPPYGPISSHHRR